MRKLAAVSLLIGLTLHLTAQEITLPNNPLAKPKPATLVRPGPDGKLVYIPCSPRGDLLPDFSVVGYEEGAVPIPEVPTRVTVAPTGAEDETENIQAALDKVAGLPLGPDGFRGAVLLKKGRYPVANTLLLSAEGVVLRGEGQGEDGTVLIATGKRAYNVIQLRALDPKEPPRPGSVVHDGRRREISNSRVEITDDYVPLGATRFTVSDVSPFKVGDEITVFRPSTAQWVSAMGMDRIRSDRSKNVSQWKEGSWPSRMPRRIVSITGQRLTIQAGLSDPIDAALGRGSVYREDLPTLRRLGVEHLRLESRYADETDEEHGWIAVQIKSSVRDAWVRQVTARYFGYSCVYTSGMRTTVMGCAYLDGISKLAGGRRYAFGIGGPLNLVRDCYSVRGRHDFVFDAGVPGPNVFLQCVGEDSRCNSEPHQRWSVGALYDHVSVQGPNGFLSAVNRGDSGSGHGWAGGCMVFWNCKAPMVAVMKPPTSQNFAIGVTGFVWDAVAKELIESNLKWIEGCSGARFQFEGTPFIGDGHRESADGPVTPDSLYWAQFADRHGVAAMEQAKKWK